MSFEEHLREAIALNRARRRYYARRTGGVSRPLSTALIRMEQGALPAAAWLDARAHPFHEAGVPIVAGDFVSMEGVQPADAPPRWDRVSWHPLRDELLALRARLVQDSRAKRFGAAADAARAMLDRLDRIEHREQAHFAMTRHVVESVGWAAAHAEEYGRRTKGATDGLARDLVVLQALSLPLAPVVDRAAQRFHRHGVGIVVNDVPPIPFARG